VGQVTDNQLLDIARREVENLKQNRIDLVADVLKVPTAMYYDEARWQLEVDRVFKRVPLALAFSCELKEPGSYRALKVAGVPVIIARSEDGAINAFVNMCSHRGNYVVDEGSGQTKSFRCEYHAWNYNLQGELTHVFDEQNFGAIDKACNGLTRLPVAERAGLVWVTLNPQSDLDIETFLSGYDDMLQHLHFDKAHLVGRQELVGPNWKVAYDGYRDFYHVPILHKNSLGDSLSHQPDFYNWGPHVRVTAPKNFAEMAELPEEQWTEGQMTQGVWTIFPNISIAGGAHRDGFYMVSQMYPGANPGESVTTQNFLSFAEPGEINTDERDGFMAMMRSVVSGEDYRTGFNVQNALATGAKEFSYFGRNEGGGQLFHRWLDAIVEADDGELAGLFESDRS
jgi:phenylpropionate dioxygenase-like ring-hydroxylating dioxygenase large terminal subunit